MRKSFLFAVLCALFFAFASESRSAQSTVLSELGNLKVGAAIPDFAGVDLSQPGVEIIARDDLLEKAKQSQGKVAVVFFSTGCLPCRVGLKELKENQATLEKSNVQVLLVALGDDKATVRRFLQQQGLTFATLHDPDGKVAARYGVMGKGGDLADARIPVTVLANNSGKTTQIITAEGLDYIARILESK